MIDFRAYDSRDDEFSPIGGRRDTAVYIRAADHSFVLDSNLSSASAKEIEDFYDDLDSNYTNEEFLNFNLNWLKQIAIGNDVKAGEWLWRFLSCCPNSPEANELRALSKLISPELDKLSFPPLGSTS